MSDPWRNWKDAHTLYLVCLRVPLLLLPLSTSPSSLLTNGYYDYKMDLWGIGCQ